jgi:indole-3-glycerol phosphate synthase
MDILKDILKHKKEEIKERKSSLPLHEIKAQIKDLPSPKPFKPAVKRFEGSSIKLIAEIKKASPTKGVLRPDFNIKDIASTYEQKNTSALSILTDERFFQGSVEHLVEVRQLTTKPLLRKDFIIDEYQIYESRFYNADAILLITTALDRHQLADFQELAKELSLESLVEIHTGRELEKALYSGAEIIGINNRDLNTMKVNLKTTIELSEEIPESVIVISESGIHSRQDIKMLEPLHIDAVLVGTSLMEAKDIGKKIDELFETEKGR